MGRFRILLMAVLFAGLLRAGDLDRAFQHLYAFDFPAAHSELDSIASSEGDRALFHTARASVYLFSEMDRLGILASEFYRDRGEKLKRRKTEPSAAVREALHASLAESRDRANNRLAYVPDDAEAHFALSLAAGIECSYAVFVEKRRRHALTLAKESHNKALETLAIDPAFRDAQLIPGINEYLVASMPFFVRWFVSFENVEGDKTRAVQQLEDVARSGRYLSSFAKILLATIHMREKRWEEARRVTADLVAHYPRNPLFRRELEKLTTRLQADRSHTPAIPTAESAKSA